MKKGKFLLPLLWLTWVNKYTYLDVSLKMKGTLLGVDTACQNSVQFLYSISNLSEVIEDEKKKEERNSGHFIPTKIVEPFAQ